MFRPFSGLGFPYGKSPSFFREFPTVGGERLVVINCPGHTSTSSMRLGFSTLFDLCLPWNWRLKDGRERQAPRCERCTSECINAILMLYCKQLVHNIYIYHDMCVCMYIIYINIQANEGWLSVLSTSLVSEVQISHHRKGPIYLLSRNVMFAYCIGKSFIIWAKRISSWWLNQPIWKLFTWIISPNFQDET